MPNKNLLYLLAGCLLFVFLYAPANLYFLSDDFDSLLFAFKPSHIWQSFRPLSDATLYLDFSIWGFNATGFHVTNTILHFSAAIGFYFLARKLFLPTYDLKRSANMAACASLLFLLYPYHSEAIFWIVGRGAILCTGFGVWSIYFYLKRSHISFYFLSILLFIAALFSYEEAWVIPLLITVISLVFRNKNERVNWRHLAGFWVIFILYLGVRFFSTQSVIGTPYGTEHYSSFNAVLLFKNAAALCMRSLVPPRQSGNQFAITSGIVVIFVFVLLWIIRKKVTNRFLLTALCFALSLVPVISLGIDTHDTESERFLYFPSIFLILLITQVAFYFELKKAYFVLIIVLIGEGIWLKNSYTSFIKSSEVCKTTVQALKKLGSIDTLFCKQLPGQYKGAFIFRNGFTSAVTLMKKERVKEVVILSSGELFRSVIPYKVRFENSSHQVPITSPNEMGNVTLIWTEEGLIVEQ